MNDDWRSRNTMTPREMAKVAGAILGLLFVCIMIAWVVTKATRSEPPPRPEVNPPSVTERNGGEQ